MRLKAEEISAIRDCVGEVFGPDTPVWLCNGQVKPDTFLGSLAVIIPFKFQRCFVPQF